MTEQEAMRRLRCDTDAMACAPEALLTVMRALDRLTVARLAVVRTSQAMHRGDDADVVRALRELMDALKEPE